MDGDNSDQNKVDEAEKAEPVSGASAYKPTTTKELDRVRKRKERESAERKRIAEEQNQQHIRKKLLAECQTLLNVNYEWLCLDEYPDNRLVAMAKRNRDYWLFFSSLEFIVFCAAMLELAPAWVGGTAFGLLFITLSFSLKSFRIFFSLGPSLSELLQERKKLEFRALNHIKLLEGQEGLAWKCRKLAKYNRNLERTLFQGVMNISAKKQLFSVIKEKKHIRLYLQLMVEAEKAYKRLQSDYLQHHFKNLEQGIDDTVAESEPPAEESSSHAVAVPVTENPIATKDASSE